MLRSSETRHMVSRFKRRPYRCRKVNKILGKSSTKQQLAELSNSHNLDQPTTTSRGSIFTRKLTLSSLSSVKSALMVWPLNIGVLTTFILNSVLFAATTSANNVLTNSQFKLSEETIATISPIEFKSAVAVIIRDDYDVANSSVGSYLNITTNITDAYGIMNYVTSTGGSSNYNLSVVVTSKNQETDKDIRFNDSDDMMEDSAEYIFDRTDIRIVFITLYTLVFCCCFFGNLLVILVVTLSRRLRSITNFFLANLALADFCVGLFCVMQNLSIYLIDSWVFGEFLCRMYQFVHSLSYTASIFILVVICMERYFAIVHPITCKQILTAARLRMVILTVWITSAVYSTPKFVFSKTIKNIHTEDGQEEEICVLDRKMFNSKLLDMINFVLLYVIPLLVMTVLYTKIAIALWRSSRGLSHHIAAQQHQQQDNNVDISMHNSMYHHHHYHQQSGSQFEHQHRQQQQQTSDIHHSSSSDVGRLNVGGSRAEVAEGSLVRRQSSKYEKRGVSIKESQVSLDAERPVTSACRKTSFYYHSHRTRHHGHGHAAHISHSSSNVLRARRGVVRMLIIFVLTFALCNLPYHARKMWQYWSRSYRGDSNFNALLTPLTFLVTYFNSGVNPLLYAFLSRNFRKGMKELLLCSWKKGKGKSSSNSSMHQKRTALQTHSLPTDTTHIGTEQL